MKYRDNTIPEYILLRCSLKDALELESYSDRNLILGSFGCCLRGITGYVYRPVSLYNRELSQFSSSWILHDLVAPHPSEKQYNLSYPDTNLNKVLS